MLPPSDASFKYGLKHPVVSGAKELQSSLVGRRELNTGDRVYVQTAAGTPVALATKGIQL